MTSVLLKYKSAV